MEMIALIHSPSSFKNKLLKAPQGMHLDFLVCSYRGIKTTILSHFHSTFPQAPISLTPCPMAPIIPSSSTKNENNLYSWHGKCILTAHVYKWNTLYTILIDEIVNFCEIKVYWNFRPRFWVTFFANPHILSLVTSFAMVLKCVFVSHFENRSGGTFYSSAVGQCCL